MGNFSSVYFEPGDYVKFIAHAGDNVPHSCTDIMEKRLFGKIFQVKNVEECTYDSYQNLGIDTCEFSEDVSDADLHWNFSSPMFELFLPPTSEACFSFSFDDLLNGLPEASTCEK